MKHYCISLLEVVQWVRGQYRNYVLAVMQGTQPHNGTPFPNNSWDLDHLPFFDALMKEIFAAQATDARRSLTPSPAVAVLMSAGLPREYATFVAQEAFKLCVDTIGVHLPEIQFGDEESFSYGLCDEYDILITAHRG